jgi:hypothetical protein
MYCKQLYRPGRKFVHMIRIAFTLAAFVFVGTACAQSVVWSTPLPVSNDASYGFTRPRIAVCNGVPVAVWGNESTKHVYASRFVNGAFSTPVQVTPNGFQAFVFDWTAQEIASAGDTLFLSFSDAASTHAYLVRSIDGGLTFGDTVQVDNIGTDVPRFPTVQALPGGNAAVMYMRFDMSFANPRYSVTRSMNGGATFMPDTNATENIPGEPCDCCPGTLVSDGNRMALLYRNNDSNIRDSWASVSLNGGASFDSGVRVDSSNWMLMSCPSSGPDGYLYGDTLASVFMNGAGGTKVYASGLDLNTMQPTSRKQIALVAGQQNYPRIAGRGDTLGVVWQQKIGTPVKIAFTSSFNGINGLGIDVDTLSLSLSGNQGTPDIAYGNGKLHVVFTDDASQKVYYTSAVLPQIATSTNRPILPSTIFTVTQKDQNQLEVSFIESFSGPAVLTLTSVLGQVLSEKPFDSIQQGQKVLVDGSSLSNGIYMLTLNMEGFSRSTKVALAR